MELSDKVVVVTGANSGIGRATALLLASKGAKLGLLDITSPKEVEEEIAAAGGNATAYQCDVRLTDQVESVVRQIVEKYGPLHGAANLAGVIGSGKKVERSITSLTETSDEEWNRIMDVNVGGTKNCLRAELRHMSPGGSLVNASSVSALIGSPWNVAYSTSKAAIIGLTKSLAQEVGTHGIRVNAIAPGITQTAMVGSLPPETQKLWAASNALGRLAQASEIAEVILFLLSDKSSFVSAAVYNIDAGRV